jgi:hypothetical protein
MTSELPISGAVFSQHRRLGQFRPVDRTKLLALRTENLENMAGDAKRTAESGRSDAAHRDPVSIRLCVDAVILALRGGPQSRIHGGNRHAAKGGNSFGGHRDQIAQRRLVGRGIGAAVLILRRWTNQDIAEYGSGDDNTLGPLRGHRQNNGIDQFGRRLVKDDKLPFSRDDLEICGSQQGSVQYVAVQAGAIDPMTAIDNAARRFYSPFIPLERATGDFAVEEDMCTVANGLGRSTDR